MIIAPQVKIGSVPGFAGPNNTGLLQTLVTWCTSNASTPGLDWEIEMDQSATEEDGVTVAYDSTYREYILSNDGASGQDAVYIGMREYIDASENKYGWALNGYLSVPNTWNGHADSTHFRDGYDDTVNCWSQLPELQLFNTEIPYWFYSTQEFIFVSVRIGTSYFQCYLGNGARFGSPDEYRYPLVIAGSRTSLSSYQNGGYGPARPTTGTFIFVDPSGVFKIPDPATNTMVLPMHTGALNTNETSISSSYSGAAFIGPVIAVAHASSTCVQLFNVGLFRRTNAQSEQVYIDEDNNKWRIFAQGKNDYDYDYLCVYEQANYSTTTTPQPTTTTTVTTTSTTTTTTTTV